MTHARRYETEFMLNTLVIARCHGRQKDLQKAELPSEPTCNLYIVSRAPRITVDPENVHFTAGGALFVILREQIKGAFKEYPVHIEHFHPDAASFRWHSEWPYDEFDLTDARGEVHKIGSISTFFEILTGFRNH